MQRCSIHGWTPFIKAEKANGNGQGSLGESTNPIHSPFHPVIGRKGKPIVIFDVVRSNDESPISLPISRTRYPSQPPNHFRRHFFTSRFLGANFRSKKAESGVKFPDDLSDLSRLILRVEQGHKRSADLHEYGRVIKKRHATFQGQGQGQGQGQLPWTILAPKTKYSDVQLPGDFRIMRKRNYRAVQLGRSQS